jgi:hypothetical protein
MNKVLSNPGSCPQVTENREHKDLHAFFLNAWIVLVFSELINNSLTCPYLVIMENRQAGKPRQDTL